MKILVINGHKYYNYSEGKLNMTLFEEILDTLSAHELKTTVVQQGYDVEAEIEKFLWADTVIFQTPVNWFALPGLFKNYFDEVYRHGVFYGPAEGNYGTGGLLGGKKYMYSLTWNSLASEFDNPEGYYGGKSVDDVFYAPHKLQEFCALEKIPTFSVHDVVRNPDVPRFKRELGEHLRKHI